MPALTQESRLKGNRKSAAVRAATAEEFYESVAPVVKQIVRKRPRISQHAIALDLKRRRIAPRRATGSWCHVQVARVLAYIEKKSRAAAESHSAAMTSATPGGADTLLIVDGRVVGPFTISEVARMLRRGSILPETVHKRPSMKACRSLHKLAEMVGKAAGNPQEIAGPLVEQLHAVQI